MILIVVSLTAFCSLGCDQLNQTAASNTPKAPAGRSSTSNEFATAMVESKPYTEKVELPGASVRGFETTRLMAKVGGYVKAIKTIDGEEIDVGTMVTKGAELAILDVPEMMDQLTEKNALVEQANSIVAQADAVIEQREAGIDQRNAEVKQAQAQHQEKIALLKFSMAKSKRIEDLVSQGTIGDENLDEVRYAVDAANAAIAAVNADIETANANVKSAIADLKKANADKLSTQEHVKVAQASVDELKTLIGYATITAPFTGIITKRMVDHGAFVRPATSNSGAMPLFEITRIDKVRVVASVPNVQAAKVQVGQNAIFHNIGGIAGVRIVGKVTRIAHTLDPESRMMRIEVHFKNPLEQPASGRTILLQPGMFGSVTVVLKEWESLAVVPTGAIETDNMGQSYVFLVVDSGSGRVAQRQNVGIAFNDANSVGLSSGVKPGETVVTKNIDQVKDGQPIPANSQ